MTVYKLLTNETVDEDIHTMGEHKRQLSEAVLTSKGEAGAEENDMGAIGWILQKALAKTAGKRA